MENNSWIKLFRKFKKWEWYDNINVSRLFLHLLLSVNYEDKKWHGILIKKGSLITSYRNLSKETGLTFQQIRSCIDKLKTTHEITIKSTSVYTLITVNKYSDYQENNTRNNKRITNEQQTDNKRITTTKEYKNIKKIRTIKEEKKYEFEKNKYTITEVAERMLKVFNQINKTNYTSIRTFVGNLEKCLESHSILDIITAIKEIPNDDFWGKINTSPEKIFRQSKDGQPKDYIEDLLNSKKENYARNREKEVN